MANRSKVELVWCFFTETGTGWFLCIAVTGYSKVALLKVSTLETYNLSQSRYAAMKPRPAYDITMRKVAERLRAKINDYKSFGIAFANSAVEEIMSKVSEYVVSEDVTFRFLVERIRLMETAFNGCEDHPQYKGDAAPTVKCSTCEAVWAATQALHELNKGESNDAIRD